MNARIADRLNAARRRRIVGRASECALFREALETPELPFYVLSVFGPGGIGKTSLLSAYAQICAELQIPVCMLNGQDMEPSPDFFQRVATLGMTERGFSDTRRQVLLIDTFEALQSLESWLRDVFLPELPGETLVVLAGRAPLSAAWRSEAGWASLIRSIPLRNLSPEESRALLADRNLPTEIHDKVLEFTFGYPLALTLVCDVHQQRGSLAFDAGAPPDIVHSLVERFLDRIPSPEHRAALEVCALLRVTTEPILARMLNWDDAHGLFDWLHALSFIEPSRPGICPHNIAREALLAELRWRNPDRYAEMHRRARAYYAERLAEAEEQEQQRLLWDYIFLHRENPIIRSSFTWQDTISTYASAPRPTDIEPLAEMVTRFEGPESARLLRHWWNHPAQTTLVFRPATGEETPLGFTLQLALDRIGPQDLAADPALVAAHGVLARRAPLRPGETATYFRFWMAADTYHEVSPVQSIIMVNHVRHYLTTPGLAYSFIPVANPERWTPAFHYAEMPREPEADFTVDGRAYSVFSHDWRQQPPMAWLSVLAEKELAGQTAAPPARRPEEILVLSEPEFVAAVREALKHSDRAESLIQSPLLRSRVVLERTRGTETTPTERAAALQSLLRETIKSLQGSRRQERAYRALYPTYLQPAPTQERAAEILDLPFSTYRRHLAEGIALVAETLWQQEIGAALK